MPNVFENIHVRDYSDDKDKKRDRDMTVLRFWRKHRQASLWITCWEERKRKKQSTVRCCLIGELEVRHVSQWEGPVQDQCVGFN